MRIGPKYKIARRLGEGIFSKTLKERFAMMEGKKKINLTRKKKHRSNLTEYGIQFLEKQRLRYSYGISERQLGNYIEEARINTSGRAADNIFGLLESRLDNVVYRLGLVPTRQFARQIVTHGHVIVNKKRVGSPSYRIKVGDIITIKQNAKEGGLMRDRRELLTEYRTPSWLSLDPVEIMGKVLAKPKPGEYETGLNFGLVIQFYSRV